MSTDTITNTCTHPEKHMWPKGPWHDEPDRAEWRDFDTGYPCLAVRGPAGAWCGYVAVPPGHAAHGKSYDIEDLRGVDAHGGITFTGGCSGHIYQVPQPGEPDNVWWIGFYCCHADDVMPAMEYFRAKLPMLPPDLDSFYRTLDYVRDECKNLAQQLKALDS